MGIYGRDYMRDPTGSARWPRHLSVTTWLILVNVGLWFLFAASRSWGGEQGGFYGFLRNCLLLHTEDVFGHWRLWQPFTAMWFHDPGGLGHIFFNMLFLYLFGKPTESLIGGRALLGLYIVAGLASTCALVPFAAMQGHPLTGLGASGAVYGVGVFLALRQPHLPFVFFVFRMPLWVLVGVFLVGRELVNLALLHHALGTTVAHLAGAAYGLIYHRLHEASPAPGVHRVLLSDEPEEQREEDVRARVDALLERIHREGIGALTAAEKDFLERASRRYGR